MQKKKFLRSLFLRPLMTLLAVSGIQMAQAQAPTASALYARANAAMCANCHGTDGKTVAQSAVPSIAGLPKTYAVAQMKAFQNGSRPATVMHQLSKGFTDAQIDALAEHFASLPR